MPFTKAFLVLELNLLEMIVNGLYFIGAITATVLLFNF
jgi:hypothetical protein